MAKMQPQEISITTGRVVCSASVIDGPGTLIVRDGRIASLETDSPLHPLPADSTATPSTSKSKVHLDFSNGILLPGLIDLHAHPAKRGSIFGVNPDSAILARGTTTVQSQGDAGADGVDDFVASTVHGSRSRVLLALNLSRIGESTSAGCFADLAHADVDACVAAATKYPDLIRMLAVNVSHHACGDNDPREVLQHGLLAAEQSGLPVLFGMRRPEDWPLEEQLSQLCPGDVVTYCFRKTPHCIIEHGRVLPCVLDARQRGILFDVGHGMGSFSFEVAEAAIGAGFLPDTISTDLQNRHAGQSPQHDLPLVMSKLSASGMTDADLFRAVTSTPAAVLGIEDEAGSLRAGSTADLVVLDRKPDITMSDVHAEIRTGNRFSACCVVREGHLVIGN
ncbi:MAG: dihydroorotase [Planctomycetaceae bacterium]|jgi:dihydroorotase